MGTTWTIILLTPFSILAVSMVWYIVEDLRLRRRDRQMRQHFRKLARQVQEYRDEIDQVSEAINEQRRHR